MNMNDNPAVSYDEMPLARRLEVLKQYQEGPRIQWKASTPVLPRSLRIKGEANVLSIAPDSVIETQELHWTTLPSKEAETIESNIFRPSNPSSQIAAHALSIEENDLFAFATWNESGSFCQIRIHLIQYSTRLPYPGLASQIMDIYEFESMMGDRSIVQLVIRGTNLAVVVGHESLQEVMDRSPESWSGHLSVWNWKTGEQKGETEGIPDKDMSLVFLKEDILLHGSSMGPSLNIYHIPTSDTLARNNLPLIECLELPRLKDEWYDPFPDFNLIISFADNPPSFVESVNQTVPRWFSPNNISSILTIKVLCEEDQNCTSYLFVIHHQTLIDRAERALSRNNNGRDIAAPVRWEEWGPDVTRMFWYNHDLYRPPLDAPCGSRLFLRGVDGNLIEVYDFGRVAKSPIQSPDESQIQTANTLSWIVDRGGPEIQGDWFEDVVHTKLPFIHRTIEGQIDGGWDTMYVDQSRIVGIKANERIDVLYIG